LAGYGTSVDPRQQTALDLIDYINNYFKDHQIILTMDSNEEDNPSEDGLFEMLRANGLISAYSKIPLLEKPPHTYIRGSRCIDYIYVSQDLLSCVTTISIQPFGSGFSSDHRPIIIQIDMGQINFDLTRHGHRSVSMRRVKDSKAFAERLEQLVTHHNLLPRLQTIEHRMNNNGSSPYLIQQWNKIDEELGRYIKAAQKRECRGNIPWSTPIARSGLTVRYWKEYRRAKIHHYQLSPKWRQIRADLHLREQPEADDRNNKCSIKYIQGHKEKSNSTL